LLRSTKLIIKEYAAWKKIFPTGKKEIAVEIDNGLIEYYGAENPKIILVTLGTVAGTIKQVIDKKYQNSVGLIKIRCYRPFPADQIRAALKNARWVIALEKAYSLGTKPPLYSDLAVALFDKKIKLESKIAGLGGQDITEAEIAKIIKAYEKN